MKRLTHFYRGLYFDSEGYNRLNGETDKLGQLEDIEEELGIDLLTLFKALKNGFYYISDDGVLFADNYNEEIGIEYYKGHNYCDYGITWAGVGVAYTKDYGKTWALTKEELE